MAPLQFPVTLGMDFSGVIEKVGEGISSSALKQGDKVYGQAGVLMGGSGAFAEMALAKAETVAQLLNYISQPALILFSWCHFLQ